MNNPHNDSGIPLLTEIIPMTDTNGSGSGARNGAVIGLASAVRDGPLAADFLMKRKTDTDALPLPIAAQVPRQVSDGSEADWEKLERDVRERVLTQMMNRIDFVLEQRIRDSLADVLQTAVTGLSEEIRSGLQQTLNEVVSRALAQEMAQLQKSKA